MTPTTSTSGPVSTAEIAELLARARSLTEAGPAAEPAERAAYLAAKTDLLARITHQQPDTDSSSTKDTP